MRALVISLLAFAGLVATPHTVLAQSKYFDLHIGYNYVMDGDVSAELGTAPVSYIDEPSFGGSIGYMAENGFRIEGEVTYRSNDLETVWGAVVDGKLNTLSVMINALYELRFGSGGGLYGSASPLRPYIGIGGGGVYSALENVSEVLGTAVIDDSDNALAYQFIAGVGVELTPSTLITFDYRYLVADNLEMTMADGTAFEVDSAHATFTVGMRANF